MPRLGGFHSCGQKTKKTKVKVLNLGKWNRRTLLDKTKADRPERRTAFVAKELARYNVDIAALSETRFADKGQLTEREGGHTFFGVVAAALSDERQVWDLP